MPYCKQQDSAETWGKEGEDEGVSKLRLFFPAFSHFLDFSSSYLLLHNQLERGRRENGVQASHLRYFAFPAFLFSWLPPFSPFSIVKYLTFLPNSPLFLPLTIILELPLPNLSPPPSVLLFSQAITGSPPLFMGFPLG